MTPQEAAKLAIESDAEYRRSLPQPVGRRDLFALHFALRLMTTRQVAPGKVAVPRDGANPTMQVQCEFGIAIKMADDLCAALDESAAGPVPTVVDGPEQQTPPTN